MLNEMDEITKKSVIKIMEYLEKQDNLVMAER
jgi:hypothetical protein